MVRIVAFVIAVLGCGTCAFGTQILSQGDLLCFYLPDGTGPLLKFTLGYGDPANTIGDAVWFSGPGSYDMSSDPDFAGFLVRATDGISDNTRISLSDMFGKSIIGPVPETLVFGSNPDLTGLPVTGAIVNVLEIDPYLSGLRVVMRWDFTGVPEPSMVFLSGAGWALVWVRSARKGSRGQAL